MRHSSRMSQRDLADWAGVRQALISQIELGAANGTLDSLLKIAIAHQVDFDALFGAVAKARLRGTAEGVAPSRRAAPLKLPLSTVRTKARRPVV